MPLNVDHVKCASESAEGGSVVCTCSGVQQPYLNVSQVLVDAGALWDAVVLIEDKFRVKHFLVEPHLGKGVKQTLVVVVSDTAAILNLPDHVLDCDPRNKLKKKLITKLIKLK